MLRRAIQPPADAAVGEARPAHEPVIGLLELIAVLGVVEEIGEVREQVEVVLEAVGAERGAGVPAATLPLDRRAVARRLSAISRIDQAKSPDASVCHRARRDLIGRVPRPAITHQRRRQAVARIAPRVANQPVELSQIVGLFPRAVAALEFERSEERAPADSRRRRDQHAAKGVVAAADPDDRTGERVRVVDVRGACGGKVAVLGEVRALRELDAARELRDEEVEIGIAVAVAVRRHVHRHPRDRRREVGAVIEVEAAQVVLVGLALAAVLADDDARYGFEDFAGAHDRPCIELARRDRALAG